MTTNQLSDSRFRAVCSSAGRVLGPTAPRGRRGGNDVKKSALILSALFFSCVQTFAAASIRAVATTSTLANLLEEVGGEKFEIHYVAPPKRDVHFISPTPKDVLKVKKAEIFIHNGLDLEVWRDPLLIAAGNPNFLGNAGRSIDLSRGISLVGIPAAVSRAEGDIHLFGNPHFWMDPENAEVMAKTLAEGLANLYPAEADTFKRRAEEFNARLDRKLKEWLERMAPYKSAAVIVQHRSWPYFMNRFGLIIAGEIELRPGIPSTAKHLAGLIQIAKEKNVRAVIREPFNEGKTSKKLSGETGIPVVTLVQSVGADVESADYISMIERNIRALEAGVE
ncbi:MAG: zinc ABC transporter substrate-binding protein [Candidatus Omnitrophica bacterium]|nr:zinc ABC transporter substrate-binding protein [Candidatus Omnitrophota bacterium]